ARLLDHAGGSGAGRIELMLIQAATPGTGNRGVCRGPMGGCHSLSDAENLLCMLGDQLGRHCWFSAAARAGAAPCPGLWSSCLWVTETVQSVTPDHLECGTGRGRSGYADRAAAHVPRGFAWPGLALALIDGRYPRYDYNNDQESPMRYASPGTQGALFELQSRYG